MGGGREGSGAGDGRRGASDRSFAARDQPGAIRSGTFANEGRDVGMEHSVGKRGGACAGEGVFGQVSTWLRRCWGGGSGSGGTCADEGMDLC